MRGLNRFFLCAYALASAVLGAQAPLDPESFLKQIDAANSSAGNIYSAKAALTESSSGTGPKKTLEIKRCFDSGELLLAWRSGSASSFLLIDGASKSTLESDGGMWKKSFRTGPASGWSLADEAFSIPLAPFDLINDAYSASYDVVKDQAGEFRKEVKLGKYQAYKLALRAKGISRLPRDIAIWVDAASLFVLKREVYRSVGTVEKVIANIPRPDHSTNMPWKIRIDGPSGDMRLLLEFSEQKTEAGKGLGGPDETALRRSLLSEDEFLIDMARVGTVAEIAAAITPRIRFSYRDKYQNNAMWYAAERDDAGAVKALLAAGAPLGGTDANGLNLLSLAVPNRNRELVDLFLSKGLDANAFSQDGVPLWATALMLGDRPIADLLLSRGADVNALCKDGSLPSVRLARSYNAGKGAPAAIELLGYLFGKGLKIDQPDKSGRTLLLNSCDEAGDAQIIGHLVKNGADVNKRDADSMTPLSQAMWSSGAPGMKGAVEFLRSKGAVQGGANLAPSDLATAISEGRIRIESLKAHSAMSGGVIDAYLSNPGGCTVFIDVSLRRPLSLANSGSGPDMIALMVFREGGRYLNIGKTAFIELPPGEQTKVALVAYSTDCGKGNLTESDGFRLGQAPAAFMKAAAGIQAFILANNGQDVNEAAQLAIWRAAGFSREEISSRLGAYGDEAWRQAESFLNPR